MALVTGIEINKTCWCIVVVPLVILNGLAFYKLWCTKTVRAIPNEWGSAYDQMWDLSNFTRIKMVYNKVAEIAGPETNVTFSGEEQLCKLKTELLSGGKLHLLKNCTIANLTEMEKRSLYHFLHLTIRCD